MATNTNDASVPTMAPQPAAPGPIQPQVNQLPPAPDPRDTAASSMMPHLPGNVSGSSKLSVITAALGYNRFLPLTFGTSTYVPSFILLSLVLSEIDRLLVHTYRFGQSRPEWHPIVSQIYYGIIFIVHVLRVRRTAQTISVDENNFLDIFETNFPLSSLPVAGPLKHFLQSITVTQGFSKFYGNTYPKFANGSDWSTTAANYYVPAGDLAPFTLPPIPILMDMLNDFHVARANFDHHNTDHWQRFYIPLTYAYGNAVPDERFFGLPGIMNLNFLPATQMPSWYSATGHIGLPPRLIRANTPTLTTIGEYMRFATGNVDHFAWFPRFIQTMQVHAQFMKDSTSLASIDTVGLGSCLPIIYLRPNPNLSPANAAANNPVIQPVAAIPPTAAALNAPATPGRAAGFATTRLTNFSITAESKFENLHLLAEQFSLLSCVNIDTQHLAARGNHFRALPAHLAQVEGPVWDLPDLKSHTQINVLGQITSFLAGVFTVDQRMTK